MRLAISKEGKYIPEWHGNRDLADSEQFYVTYQNLSSDERARYEKKGQMRVLIPDVYNAKDADVDEAVKRVTVKAADGEYTPPSIDVTGILRAMKPTFHNFELEDGTPVVSWADFLRLPVSRENGLALLRTELERELPSTQEAISEPDKKN